MIREMLRISLLLAGATVGLTAGHPPAHAQVQPAPRASVQPLVPQMTPQPTPRANVPMLVPNYGTTTSPTINSYQRLDAAQNTARLGGCASMSGAASDRCYSDVRAKIQSDDLRQRAIDSSFTRRDKEEKGK